MKVKIVMDISQMIMPITEIVNTGEGTDASRGKMAAVWARS